MRPWSVSWSLGFWFDAEDNFCTLAVNVNVNVNVNRLSFEPYCLSSAFSSSKACLGEAAREIDLGSRASLYPPFTSMVSWSLGRSL